LSFTKGCYVGQEIVARTQHLGRIKRRMYRARLTDRASVEAGDTLKAAQEEASASVQVVNAKPAPAGGFDVLAVMPIELAAGVPRGGVALVDGSQLELQALPYALVDETV
jgi:folate-binding Fe-S cluster repair protein YgfZ